MRTCFLRDRHVPRSKKGKPPWKSKGSIPISVELRQLIKDKKRLHRRWIKAIETEDKTSTRQSYIRTRNRVNSLMVQTKRQYERSICNQSKRNPKIFWKHIRRKLKSKTGVSPLLETANDEKSLKFDDLDKASILQKQFCSVFTEEPDGDLPNFNPKTEKEIQVNITIDMLRREIISINPNKAVGPDEIHPKMLKELVDYVTIPLSNIMKKSLSNGILPNWPMSHLFLKKVRGIWQRTTAQSV